MTAPALVVLAAGLGSRYGDTKQIAGVGPDGEWLLEYAVHDALAAGFEQMIIVIRAELRDALQRRLEPHAGKCLQFVEQSFDRIPAGCRVPAGRTKPLGTGHALWCCAPLLQAPFAVINADDYYGRAAFRLLADHFRAATTPAMVGYRLAATLSTHGGVNRGVCSMRADGSLLAVTEYIDIAMRHGVLAGNAPPGMCDSLAPDTIVSLNCWGLLPTLLPDLEVGLRAFLARAGTSDEYFLPHAITAHLAARDTRLAVLPTRDSWLGLTYPDDRPHVVAAIAALHATGAYPTPLWSTP